MKDDGKVLTLDLLRARAARIAAFAFFSLFGLASVALFAASVTDPDGTPQWLCLAIGMPWTLLCVLGIATTHRAEIDGEAKEIRRVISRFGVRSVERLRASDIARIGVVPTYRKSGVVSGYEVTIETRAPIPFAGMALAWPIQWYLEQDEAKTMAERIGARIGLTHPTS